MTFTAPLLPLMLATPILAAMAVFDLRLMRIPGPISILLFMAFALIVPWTAPFAEVSSRLVIAAIVFGLGFAAFAMRMVGGGDVKALTALMLLVPTHFLALFMLTFAGALVLGVTAVLSVRRLCGSSDSNWAFLRNKTFPMGISIASAGLLLPLAAGIWG